MNKTFIIPSDDLYLTTNIQEGQLPEFLNRAISVADEPSQQDMLLLGTLTACSYAMPKVRILHGMPQHCYYPNLMTLVVAPPAAGKGVLNYMHRLMEPIHKKMLAMQMSAIIPANSSSAAFQDLLAMNNGMGLMIETEMDVLSQIWKADYGNYSYMFRQAFEHEALRRARKNRAGTVSYTEIPCPRLSAILSGTPNQLKPLLMSRDNGLASRFVPYLLDEIVPFDSRVFKHGDHIEENGALPVFEELSKELQARWEWLIKQQNPLYWSLTDEQSDILGALFDDGYKLALEEMHLPISFDATVKRLAVTIKRIGAILTALRLDMTQPLPEVVFCSDDDFHTIVMLAEKFLRHAALMTLMLPEEEKMLDVQVRSDAADRKEELFNILPEKFTTQEAVDAGAQLGIKKRSVTRYITDYCESGCIKRTCSGHYVKVKK